MQVHPAAARPPVQVGMMDKSTSTADSLTSCSVSSFAHKRHTQRAMPQAGFSKLHRRPQAHTYSFQQQELSCSHGSGSSQAEVVPESAEDVVRAAHSIAQSLVSIVLHNASANFYWAATGTVTMRNSE
jgi:3-polyprenyl-4-hydroxybenzoate decarboxylase